ncbi:DUF7547 family protein [Natrarchaeobius chitinivorans]|uniref:Uncharacterized protein n=1 Tax=Natrarchaeobius chitinivorans TaxID=1679083 RepID=A0A3N6MY74_NATCH|nr:hypothetical protein [Natrarchaeobius chitinivorans]RQG90512.1 hypothetical protein EA473_21005 [Natrarchaeobius chitinivorans]
MADRDEELAEAIRELTRTIDELSDELETPRRRPPLRPPTPRELLSFTDEVAIPALLAVLESSVRALEAFQRGLELVRTEREVRDRTSEAAAVSSDRANELRRTTISRLDTVLAELQRAASEGTLPADDRARDLLTDARALRDEVDERLQAATDDSGDGRTQTGTTPVEIDIGDGAPRSNDESDTEDGGSPEGESAVDVDAELETLKDQYGPDEEPDASEPADDHERVDGDGSGSPESGDDPERLGVDDGGDDASGSARDGTEDGDRESGEKHDDGTGDEN